jgi:hypothetical protein
MQGKLALKNLQHGTKASDKERIKSRAPLSLENALETGDPFDSNLFLVATHPFLLAFISHHCRHEETADHMLGNTTTIHR